MLITFFTHEKIYIFGDFLMFNFLDIYVTGFLDLLIALRKKLVGLFQGQVSGEQPLRLGSKERSKNVDIFIDHLHKL